MEKEESRSSFLITCMRCSNILRDHHVGRKVSARQINTTDIVCKAKQLLTTKPSNLSLKTDFNNLTTERAFDDFFVNLAESLCSEVFFLYRIQSKKSFFRINSISFFRKQYCRQRDFLFYVSKTVTVANETLSLRSRLYVACDVEMESYQRPPSLLAPHTSFSIRVPLVCDLSG